MLYLKIKKFLNMSLQTRLLIFFFVTSLGSALSSVATFLSIESYFQSIILLSLALSVRTLASASFSYFANNIIQKLGLQVSLVASQGFGCLALLVLFLGFHCNAFLLTLMGIILTGLPATFVAILLSIILKAAATKDNELFRTYSGRRELFFGVALFLASFLAPLLLLKFNLGAVFLLDAISYLLGLGLLWNLKIHRHVKDNNNDKKVLSFKLLFYTSKEVNSFLLKTSAALLLAGLLPLFASSSKISFTMHMPALLRQWLWSIEDITAIFASSIYLLFTGISQKKWFESVLILNSIWLVIPLAIMNNYSIIIAIIILYLLIDFAYQKFRDDLIISAGEDMNLIKAYSALSQLQRNFIFFLSPIILSCLLTYADKYSVVVLIFTQIIFYSVLKLSSGLVINRENVELPQ